MPCVDPELINLLSRDSKAGFFITKFILLSCEDKRIFVFGDNAITHHGENDL